ncbi:hypothetical protein PoB_006413900 [Plakobranchus ocellatus]|uniref:Secreted protein n=1 Tax=Plakobranchus ocellatus TaxID=259542 RepID=A0AAV4D0F6_9GAST|nr:hypothetical protein PoB_006413900 [Plakobranchus ocellatus]
MLRRVKEKCFTSAVPVGSAAPVACARTMVGATGDSRFVVPPAPYSVWAASAALSQRIYVSVVSVLQARAGRPTRNPATGKWLSV